jgi:hypothetical protein
MSVVYLYLLFYLSNGYRLIKRFRFYLDRVKTSYVIVVRLINPDPEDPSSPGYAAAGPGFDFTPEGWRLPLDVQWNDGMAYSAEVTSAE